MDDHWVVDDAQYGDLLSMQLEDGSFRMQWDRWEHDCLDIDLQAGVAMHRQQGGAQSDDPSTWETRTYEIRRAGTGWEIHVSEDEVEAWRRDGESTVASKADFQERFPRDALRDEVAPAKERLSRLGALQPGWVPLALAVSRAIDQQAKGAR